MTQADGGYELTPKPEEPPASQNLDTPAPSETPSSSPSASKPKPGEPGWVPPVPVIEPPDPGEGEDPDVEAHKGSAILGYLVFLVPMLAAPNSKFAKYHANQALLLFILFIVVCIGVAVLQGCKVLVAILLKDNIPVLTWFFGCGLALLQPALLVGWVALMIVGMMNAANGLKKPLPVVGHWNLIK